MFSKFITSNFLTNALFQIIFPVKTSLKLASMDVKFMPALELKMKYWRALSRYLPKILIK